MLLVPQMHIRTGKHQNALLRAFSFNGATGAARHAAFISARASRGCGSSALLRAVCEAPQAGGGYAGTTRLARARDPRVAGLMALTGRCVSENEGRSEPAVVNWIERGSFTSDESVRQRAALLLLGHGWSHPSTRPAGCCRSSISEVSRSTVYASALRREEGSEVTGAGVNRWAQSDGASRLGRRCRAGCAVGILIGRYCWSFGWPLTRAHRVAALSVAWFEVI